jgi:hypothetical protein
MDRHLREFTASSLMFQQDLPAMKSNFKELDGGFSGTVETGTSAAPERVASSTQSSLLTLEGVVAAQVAVLDEALVHLLLSLEVLAMAASVSVVPSLSRVSSGGSRMVLRNAQCWYGWSWFLQTLQ